jgi:hypothetical protein
VFLKILLGYPEEGLTSKTINVYGMNYSSLLVFIASEGI